VKRRKAFLYIRTAALILCLLSACGSEEPAETSWSEDQMAWTVWSSQGEEDCQSLRFGEKDFEDYLADYYGVSPEDVAGGTVLYAGGVSASEVAVLRMTEEADGAEVQRALEAYIDSRSGAFAGYAPEQYAVLEQADAVRRGQYAVLLICPDQEAALASFDVCFSGAMPRETPDRIVSATEPEPAETKPLPDPILDTFSPAEEPAEPELPSEAVQEEPPEPEPKPEPDPETEPEGAWAYDKTRILDAWRSGEWEGLHRKDLAILEACDQLEALRDDSLSDYQRELALHDWMVEWAEYDPGELSSGPIGEPMPDNDNPYGLLTGGKGICLGYASTFQLFMEMANIECVTIQGLSHRGTVDHAWNMVKLDGEWYCVDVTWDDPVASFEVPRNMAHKYFNVTSEYMRQHDHQWDETGVPEAEGTALAWAGD